MNWPAPENRGAKCSCMALHHTSGRFTIVEYCGWLQNGPMPNGGNTSSLWKAKLAFKFHSQKHHTSEIIWRAQIVKDWLTVTLKSLSKEWPHLEAFHRAGGLNRAALARNTYRIACALIICFYCAVHVTKTMRRRKNMIRLESAWAKPQSIASSHFVVPDAVLCCIYNLKYFAGRRLFQTILRLKYWRRLK